MHVTSPTSPTPTLAHLHSLLAKFESVMLITFDQVSPVPHLRARPMGIAKLGGDCSLSFFTSASSEKVAEALLEGTAHVTMQKDDVSITLGGRCTLTQDRAVMAPLFNKSHEAWFPQGLDDPDLALLQFHPGEAEIWDTTGVKGLQLVASMAKALFTGTEVDHAGSHARVLLPTSSLDGKNVTP